MASLTSEQQDDLQAFIKDWLRHAGRTQADLRRALQASSIRMPVLMEVLAGIHASQGLSGLAAQLCGIEERWQGEDHWHDQDHRQGGQRGRGHDQWPPAVDSGFGLDDSMGQLDLLLEEIRMEQAG